MDRMPRSPTDVFRGYSDDEDSDDDDEEDDDVSVDEDENDEDEDSDGGHSPSEGSAGVCPHHRRECLCRPLLIGFPAAPSSLCVGLSGSRLRINQRRPSGNAKSP